jgi:hypothetical protein
MAWIGSVMIVIVIGLFAAITYGAVRHHRNRIAEIQALANQLKLQYFPKGDASIGPLLSNLEFFQQGTQRKITHLLKGQVKHKGQSITVAIFDYQYTLGRQHNHWEVSDNSAGFSSKDDTSSFFLTALVFYGESLNLPRFELRLEHLMDKMANVIGLQDINFSEFPTFSKRYRLLGTMPDRIRAVFQPNIIKFYECEKLCTEACGSSVLIFSSDTLPNVSQTTRIENGKTHIKSHTLNATEIRAYLDKGLNLLSMLEHNQAQA